MELKNPEPSSLEDFLKTVKPADCYHFPQHHYEWYDLLCAHCVICGTDYAIKPIKGVTLNGVQIYVPSKN